MLILDKVKISIGDITAVKVQYLPVFEEEQFFCATANFGSYWNIFAIFLKTFKMKKLILLATTILVAAHFCMAQQRGAYNYAKKTAGEREGDLTPSAIAGVSIAVVAAVAGFIVTIFFCYYVYKQQKNHGSSSNNSFPTHI
ncbi:hypothetical protein X975_03194, partial [Stegodyphus mimosarum]